MISYERIDCSEGIDFNKGKNSVKCMICGYYYFKGIGFKYQPYVCITIKNVDYRVYITGVDKKAAVFIFKNSDLSNKGIL